MATGLNGFLPAILQDNPYFGAGFGLTLLGVGLAVARRSAALLQVHALLWVLGNVTGKARMTNVR